MPVHAIFQLPAAIEDPAATSIGTVRASESIATGATGSITAEVGECAFLLNTEVGAVYVAHGATPDASATVSTDDTTARYAVPAGVYTPVFVSEGDKFAVAVI